MQLLQLPSLLYALTQDEGLVAAPPMLLGTIDGQAAASHVFKGWQEASPQQSMDSGISAAHGPALLAFAAAVSLLQSLPDASGMSLASGMSMESSQGLTCSS